MKLGFEHILGGHRPSAVPALPRDSVPPHPAARRDRHGVHRRALDHADRVAGRFRARRALVPAADRGADRRCRSCTWRSRTSSARSSSGGGSWRSGSGSCTASASHSRCASRCSSRAPTWRRRSCRSTSAWSSASWSCWRWRCQRSAGCSRASCRSGWGRSSCRRSSPTRRGTGCSTVVLCSPAIQSSCPSSHRLSRRVRSAA